MAATTNNADEALINLVGAPLRDHRFRVEKMLEAITAVARPPSVATGSLQTTLHTVFNQTIETDRKLALAVKKLKQHQEAQKVLEALQTEIQAKDALFLNYAKALRSSEKKLSAVLQKHSYVLENARNRDRAEINPADIVAYAHRIAGTTSAPSYWKPGFPMFGFMPPAPQEQMMRAGVLSRGIVEETVIQEPEASPMEGGVASPSSSTSNVSKSELDVPIGISLPENLQLAKIMPAGWKPGDAIELPSDVSIPHVTEEFVKEHQIEVPPGWKSGDPVLFSALKSVLKRSVAAISNAEKNDISKRAKMDESDSDDDDSSDNSESDTKQKTISLSFSSDEDSD